jgi:hypothetical protein
MMLGELKPSRVKPPDLLSGAKSDIGNDRPRNYNAAKKDQDNCQVMDPFDDFHSDSFSQVQVQL